MESANKSSKWPISLFIFLGKLSYVTHLNSSAIKGNDFPKINHDFQASGEQLVRSL